MQYTGTKKRIIDASLDLFSKYGYEATSMSQIADAVGMTKSSLYSHFDSKKDIFDKFLIQISEYYEENAYFSTSNTENLIERYSEIKNQSPKEIADSINKQMDFLAFDPVISKLRKVLTIEQYRNSELSELKEKRSYTEIINYYTGLMKYLIQEGVLEDHDPEVMAMLFAAPISKQLQRIDRDPSCKEEAQGLIEKCITEFFRIYQKK